MKKILSALQSALAKVDNFNDRRPELLADQRELQAKLPTLTAGVAKGDTKSINALTIAKARLEILPDELAAAQGEYDSVIDEIRDLIVQINPVVSHLYNLTYARIKESSLVFLRGYLGSNHLVEQISDTITTHSIELSELNKYRIVFGGIFHFNQKDVDIVISRARYAVENLKAFSEK